MAYVINLTNGTQVATIEDGTIDQTTTLKLVGKNYAGYGEIQNENFVHLMENFSSANQPASPLSGQIWFDSSVKKLKFYDGTKFRTTGGAEVSTAQPVGLTTGDFWWDTSNNQLYAQNSDGAFVLIGPQSIGDTVSAMVTATVKDTANINRTIIKATVNDSVIYIISDTEFTIDTTDSSNLITGFDVIRQGLTLRNTTASTAGVTSTSYRYHGTATNAEKLGGVDASNFIQSGGGSSPVFSSVVRFADPGITLGAANDFTIFIDETGSGDEAVIQNTVGQKIRFKVQSVGGVATEPMHISAVGLIPTQTTTYDIGTTNFKWRAMYATDFFGKATNAQNLQVGSNFRTGDTSPTNNTVAVRDATGNLSANTFNGIASSAKYADLAENYTTDKEYPIGTAVSVDYSDEHDHEVTWAKASSMPIGVVSEAPAYLMNSESEGQAIGLKGRVPVRVKGAVKKGEAVYAWDEGVCSTVKATALVGIALETSTDESEKLIECVLKV